MLNAHVGGGGRRRIGRADPTLDGKRTAGTSLRWIGLLRLDDITAMWRVFTAATQLHVLDRRRMSRNAGCHESLGGGRRTREKNLLTL